MGASNFYKARSFEKEAVVHLNVLYGAALRMTQNRTDAEDLVQETFLRAYRFYDRFEEGTNCRAWLLKILTNIFINAYNKKKSGPDFIGYEDSGEYFIFKRLIESDYLENLQYDVDSIFGGLLDDDLKCLLSRLSVEFRKSVVLCDIQGFSYAEVAEATNVAVGTVKSRLFRARRKLQRGLWEWAVVNGYAPKGYVNESA